MGQLTAPSDPDFKYMEPNDSTKGFYIIQPGSTVATALSAEETKNKHVGIVWVMIKIVIAVLIMTTEHSDRFEAKSSS